MSTSHPLNQAVIAQALYDLRNGQLRRCKAMGFGEAELDALKHPALISVLANASVSWCSVTVNREAAAPAQPGAGRGEGNRHSRSHAAAGRQHGDGQPLLWPDPSGSRPAAGDPRPAQAQGRHPVLDETQDTELWRQWKAVTSSRNVDLEDETSILDAAMDLAEGMSLPLSVVWAAIRNWVDQGLG